MVANPEEEIRDIGGGDDDGGNELGTVSVVEDSRGVEVDCWGSRAVDAGRLRSVGHTADGSGLEKGSGLVEGDESGCVDEWNVDGDAVVVTGGDTVNSHGESVARDGGHNGDVFVVGVIAEQDVSTSEMFV